MAQLNTGHVAEGLGDTVVLSEHDEGSLAGDVASVASLTGTSSDVAGLLDSVQVLSEAQLLEHRDRFLGLLDTLEAVRDNQGQLGDLGDSVTSGHDQGGQRRGGDRGGHGVALLGHVGRSVPSSPGLVRGEHVTSLTHVTEGTGTGLVGTATRNTGDTRNGSSGSPRLSRVLVAGELGNSVGLSSVLRDISEDSADQVGSQRSREDSSELNGLSGGLGRVLSVVHRNNGSSERHSVELPYEIF